MTAASLLGELKDLRVLVLHPQDAEARLVVGQLQRIGCRVTQVWPVPTVLPGETDVVLLSIELDQRAAIDALVAGLDEQAPPVIAIVGYESPSMLELVLSAQPAAVIERPLKPFGLLTQLIMARATWRRRMELLKQLRKLEVRQSAVGRVAMAKMLLIARHGISEDEAHKRIQRQAMAQRSSVEVVARAIIEHEPVPRGPP